MKRFRRHQSTALAPVRESSEGAQQARSGRRARTLSAPRTRSRRVERTPPTVGGITSPPAEPEAIRARVGWMPMPPR